MCWVGVSKKDKKELIAEDNIPVTKIVRIGPYNAIISYFQFFEYKLNKVYYLYKSIDMNHDKYTSQGYITKGFHSYASDIKVEVITESTEKYDYAVIYNRCYDPIARYYMENSYHGLTYCLALADCVIPKGSHYYLNNEGCYVSDSIKIINVYKIK